MKLEMNRREFEELTAALAKTKNAEAIGVFNSVVSGKVPEFSVTVKGDFITLTISEKKTRTFLKVLGSHGSRIASLIKSGISVFALPSWMDELKSFGEDLKKVF